MIAFVRGSVLTKAEGQLVVDVGGVGYELAVPARTLARTPDRGEVELFVHTHVREDALQLFGFADSKDKGMFKELITITGIGPKVALSVLSVFTVEALTKAVVEKDADAITAVPGIGRKGAQRIILELRERLGRGAVGDDLTPEAGAAYAEATKALVALGYTAGESKKALEGFDHEVGPADAARLIKFGLKNLAATG